MKDEQLAATAGITDEQIIEAATRYDLPWRTEPERFIGFARSVLALSAPPAAVAGGAAQPSWQPIETAPKDGTEILLGAPGRVTYGYWLKPSDIPRIKYQDGFAPEEEWDDFDPHWMSMDGGFTEEHPPTHWQPKPLAPDAALCAQPAAAAPQEQQSELLESALNLLRAMPKQLGPMAQWLGGMVNLAQPSFDSPPEPATQHDHEMAQASGALMRLHDEANALAEKLSAALPRQQKGGA